MFSKKKKVIVKKHSRKIEPKLMSFTCGSCDRIVIDAKDLNCPYCKNG